MEVGYTAVELSFPKAMRIAHATQVHHYWDGTLLPLCSHEQQTLATARVGILVTTCSCCGCGLLSLVIAPTTPTQTFGGLLNCMARV